MKLLIISDIHSNVHALEAVYEQERDSDIIYCAGDLVDIGPYPKEVIEWVQAHDVHCVQGNHDRTVIECYRDPKLQQLRPEERLWKHHNALQLDETHIEFLEQLPESITFNCDGWDYVMQHMYKGYEPIKSLEELRIFWMRKYRGQSESISVQDAVQDQSAKRLIFGHTHRQTIHYYSQNESFINPGSLAYDKGFDFVTDVLPVTEVHYMTITDGVVEMKTLAYDRDRLFADIEEAAVSQAAKDRLVYLSLSDYKQFDEIPMKV